HTHTHTHTHTDTHTDTQTHTPPHTHIHTHTDTQIPHRYSELYTLHHQHTRTPPPTHTPPQRTENHEHPAYFSAECYPLPLSLCCLPDWLSCTWSVTCLCVGLCACTPVCGGARECVCQRGHA